MLVIGLAMTVVGLALAGKRVLFLFRLITSGKPAPDRIEGVTHRLGTALKTQLVEVFGQKKLLKWSIPGAAHFFVFWAFLILGSVYLEAFGILLSRNPEWAIPVVGHWDALGFAQDFIAVMALVGIVVFAKIRLKEAPSKLGRKSRFAGSHLGGAYLVLFMIFNVIWTMFFFRGAAVGAGNFPYGNGAFVSHLVGHLFGDSEVLEGVGLLLHIGIMLVFLVEVVNSKHLHIFVAPINVLFGRRPVALGAVKPLMSEGKPVTLDDIDDLDEDATLGVGSIEDFSWKGLLDMATCTECGRCQSQCPAWNTEKPLSPKMLMLNLRDHAFAKAPYILADESERDGLSDEVKAEAARPLIGDPSAYGVIDPDVLWSCVTCGACVEQCPVDIEHVDHIIDMRRYQVLVESSFPAELNQLFKGMENKGNPWNMSPTARMDWAKDLPFDVKVVGGDGPHDVESLDEVEWLFWVGCAGAYEDRAKKTTRAVAELLDMAGVSFGVLGNGETCTGDQARRAGNEFVFQGLAQQNVETFKEYKVKKVVSTCAHCFNTLKNEYKEFGIELEVVHHTQLLNRLVREGKLTPVADGEGAAKRSITYHDPCYIGRHNGVYSPPRELLQVLPGAEFVEMERNSEKSFCCGAGGARMWMEETIGERINVNRTNEAVGTGADQIAVGCPFCRVMLSDGLTAAQADGTAREEVEVLDVAQMLLASVKGERATRYAPGGASVPAGKKSEETRAEPEAGDVTQTSETVTATEDVGPAANASGGSSLFDTPAEEAAPPEPKKSEGKPAAAETSGGSLFDLGGDDGPAAETAPPAAKEPAAKAQAAAVAEADATKSEADEVPAEAEAEPDASPKPATKPEPKAEPSTNVPESGSLFDISPAEPAAAPAAKAEPKTEPTSPAKPAAAKPAAAKPAAGIPEGGSLFDIASPEPAPAPTAKSDPEPEAEAEREPEAEAEPETVAEPEPAQESTGSGDELSPGAAISAAATAAASSAPADEPEDSTDEPGPGSDDEDAAEEDPKPASSGEAHQPKTDVDINESGSLFDL
ncbi:(Fe-S)-binding protein [Nocardioides sp.]|uniref:(Fe-S)-binding protein n=1 Tax=Nocardioides sp. TaxID=35761 RepID=UPI0031FE696B